MAYAASASMVEAALDAPLPRPPRRRGLWPLALMVTTLVGIGVLITLLLSRRPDPLRVLVAIDIHGVWWKGSPASAALSSSLAARLERLGFDAVRPGDPETIAALGGEKTPEAAARRVGAAFLVTGQLTPEIEDFGTAGGQVTARAGGPVVLSHESKTETDLGPVESWATARSKDEALRALAESLADPVFDRVAVALLEHPAIENLLEHGDAAERGRLSRAKTYLEQRRTKLDEARRAYDKVAAQKTAEGQSPVRVTYHGAIDRNAGLCAATSQGVLVKSDQVQPFYSPDSRELSHILLPERVAWVEADGKERSVLEGYGFHGYAAATPEGAPVVAVEDLFGWGRAVTTVDAGGQRRRLRIDVQRWPSDPKVAPGGGFVALWERGCRGCPPSVVVLDLAKGEERYKSDARKATLGGFAWLDAQRLVVLERTTEPLPAPAEGSPAPDRQKNKPPLVQVPWSDKPVFLQTLTVVHLVQRPPKLEQLYESRNEGLSALAGSRDGRFVAMARRSEDGKELAVFDVQARALSTFTALAADNPSLSANGDWVAFERGGDIAVLERSTGAIKVLTNTAPIERYPLFSADGARVLFESRAEDPNYPRRTLSVIGSVSLR
jgi:hypothetical protein